MSETLGLYIQIPFCASKCSFCNFSSRVAPASAYDGYVCSLGREVELLPQLVEAEEILPDLLALPVDTLYLGGGTPSLLGSDKLRRLIGSVRGRFRFAKSCEATIEITPGSADEALLAALIALGFNRLRI